jgi:hypothetical protein
LEKRSNSYIFIIIIKREGGDPKNNACFTCQMLYIGYNNNSWEGNRMKLTKTLLSDPEKYVENALKTREITANTFTDIWLEYRVDKAKLKPKMKFSIAELKMVYEKVLSDREKSRLKELGLSLSVTTPSLHLLEQWVLALTGEIKEANVLAMAHWLWMVKRNALDLPVVYHLFLILKGRQLSGKTTAIERLTAPLKTAKLDMDAGEVGDPNTFSDMSNYLIVFLDELVSLSKVDSTKLKKQVTSEMNSFRPFYTQKRVQVKNRTSYIGTSNKSIKQIFYDSTGMRRFFQIDCQPRVDREIINSIDYVQLWKGIDETLETGYCNNSNWDKISAIQSTYVNKEDYEDFFEEFKIKPGNGTYKSINLKTLYLTYSEWSRTSGYRFQQSKAQFRTALELNDFIIVDDVVKVHTDTVLPGADKIKEEQTVLDFVKGE